jgi:hypothetical protein
MFLPTVIACKIGAIVFLFSLMLYDYNRTPAIFFSIHLICFSVAIDSLTANALHLIWLSKWHSNLMQFIALFATSNAIITLYNWLLHSQN